MRALDSISFPLSGPSLIEASAGTGKTYTIVNVYLRLLLGHQCQPLSVDQILVVTFTKAATAELKDRIRQRLHSAYLDFYAGSSNDPFVQILIEQSENRDLACQRLSLATRQMDEASVFTIHSFCQRMLTQHAFESGALYEQNLITDESEWLTLAVNDYWRKYVVTQPLGLLKQLTLLWSAPEALLKSIRSLIYRHSVSDDIVTIEDCHDTYTQFEEGAHECKQWWVDNDIGVQLAAAKLKGNTKLGRRSTYDSMLSFCQSDELSPLGKEGWGAFSAEKFEKAKSKSTADISHIDLTRFEHLSRLQILLQQQVKLAFSQHALECVRSNLEDSKSLHNLLAPDDLLGRLKDALHEEKGVLLGNTIRTAFPAALIDEFQDTDPNQFDIFRSIFQPSGNDCRPCWIMIGDPKQAIYAFRGADIFTYIEAKNIVPEEQHFTLATNWRSQANLVNAVNQLFDQSEFGFMFDNAIPFLSVDAAKPSIPVISLGQSKTGLEFQHLVSVDPSPVSWGQAQKVIARHTANQIADLLNDGASIEGKQIGAGDCCVLVRDRGEADLVKQALNHANVASVFLIRKSVFASQTSIDLFHLLKAIAEPNNERLLKAALATELFAMNASELDLLIADELAWQGIVEQCFMWQAHWQQQGVMMLINQICQYFEIPRKLIEYYTDGLRRLTDLRHLTELAQQQSLLTPGESQLLHWFGEMISDPDHDNEGQQLRLETDENLVQIVTMHAAKGLEFPLVFVPFSCRYRETKDAIYHDHQNLLRLDYLARPASLEKADFERLAEDIRLLYVAVTRAIYYCSVGVWNNAHNRIKKQSEFAKTAVGKLLLSTSQVASDELIGAKINRLAESADIGYVVIEDQEYRPLRLQPVQEVSSELSISKLSKPVFRHWQLTSYSAISRQQQHEVVEMPGLDEGVSSNDNVNENNTVASKFSFVKGAQAGSFLHGVLENIDFMQPDNLADVIIQQGQWYGIEEHWFDVVETWIRDVLATPIGENQQTRFRLMDLAQDRIKVEMEFHIPLFHVCGEDFNRVINQFSPQYSRHYQFEKLHGMLKGFIDLTLQRDGKFYVADYKSNYLGAQLEDYQGASLEAAMQEHDYHLQALLYIVALHRWLGLTLEDYRYETHIGGAYYLFLRGMERQSAQTGVYFTLPDKALIEALDHLFKTGQVTNLGKAGASNSSGQLDLW